MQQKVNKIRKPLLLIVVDRGDLKTATEEFKQAQAVNPNRAYDLEATGKNLMLT